MTKYYMMVLATTVNTNGLYRVNKVVNYSKSHLSTAHVMPWYPYIAAAGEGCYSALRMIIYRPESNSLKLLDW